MMAATALVVVTALVLGISPELAVIAAVAVLIIDRLDPALLDRVVGLSLE